MEDTEVCLLFQIKLTDVFFIFIKKKKKKKELGGLTETNCGVTLIPKYLNPYR